MYMKQIILIAGLVMSANFSFGQILNDEFDNWILVDTLGQSYQDLVGWETNNGNLGNGFATSPNLQISENNDAGVAITTNHQGIDGLSSGRIKQTITAFQLVDISYFSKCDSVFNQGACVVNIYDSADQLIYTDSIKQVEVNYTVKSIDVSLLALNNSNELTVEFVAFGQLGEFEEFQAYSEFNLLRVNSNYISSNIELNGTKSIGVYPNPFHEIVNLEIKNDMLAQYNLFDSKGRLIRNGIGNRIETVELVSGIYFLEVLTGDEAFVERIIKQ